MKNIIFIFLIGILSACAPRLSPFAFEQYDDGIPFDASIMFEDGCLIPDIAEAHAANMPCLDLNNDGCVTRENWDAFMNIWMTRAPEPDIPLCEQL